MLPDRSRTMEVRRDLFHALIEDIKVRVISQDEQEGMRSIQMRIENPIFSWEYALL